MLTVAILVFSCGGEDQTVAPMGGRTQPVKEAASRSDGAAQRDSLDPDSGSPDGDPVEASIDVAPEVLSILREGKVAGVRPISSRSLSLKIVFEGGAQGVFKPVRKDDHTARYEVAFYRLAGELAVGTVPPSVMRDVPRARILGHLERNFEETAARFAGEAKVDDRGMVSGAMIDWVDDMGPSGLDGPGGWKKLASLLAIDGPAPDGEPLVLQASNMVVLDHVLGNWDRYSGGNLFASRDGNLILLDNNGAFAPWSEGQRKRTSRTLDLCKRFSRKLIEDLRSLDEERVRAALEVGKGEPQLLTDKEVMRIFERRDQLISAVDNLIAIHGRESVLSLP